MSAPWLETAKANLGIAELRGKQNNPRIIEMYAKVGHEEIVDEDVAWCAAHVGACLVDHGQAIPPKENNLMARSYLRYGKRLDKPKPGAIVVKARGKPPFGHVGIVEEVNGDGSFVVIAGNSGNKVKRETWKPSDPLPGGIRWPVAAGAKPPAEKPIVKTAVKSTSVWAQITALLAIVTGYLTDWASQAWAVIASLVGLLPTISSEGSSTVESTKEIFSWFELDWGMAGMTAAVGSMAIVLWRHIQEKRRVGWD